MCVNLLNKFVAFSCIHDTCKYSRYYVEGRKTPDFWDSSWRAKAKSSFTSQSTHNLAELAGFLFFIFIRLKHIFRWTFLKWEQKYTKKSLHICCLIKLHFLYSCVLHITCIYKFIVVLLFMEKHLKFINL